MKEAIEFRIPEPLAEKHLPWDIGERIRAVRRVTVDIDDPLLARIGEIDRELRSVGRAFFTAWIPKREYSQRELGAAKAFKFTATKLFEPAGEECGTVYDDDMACPICGSGAPQITPLHLNGARIPADVDIAETIAGELVVSLRVAELFQEHLISGVRFGPIQYLKNSGSARSAYFQLIAEGPAVDLDGATRAGADPFDGQNEGRCPLGDLVGLNLLSEISFSASTHSERDVVETKQLLGARRGLLRPRPVLVFSAKAWRHIVNARLRGFRFEVAHPV